MNFTEEDGALAMGQSNWWRTKTDFGAVNRAIPPATRPTREQNLMRGRHSPESLFSPAKGEDWDGVVPQRCASGRQESLPRRGGLNPPPWRCSKQQTALLRAYVVIFRSIA